MQNLCCCHWHRLKAPRTLCVIVIEWLPTNDSADITFEHAFLLDVWLVGNAFNYVCKLYWIRLPDAHCWLEFSILLHKHTLNIFLLIYRNLRRYSYRYLALGKKDAMCYSTATPVLSYRASRENGFPPLPEGEMAGKQNQRVKSWLLGAVKPCWESCSPSSMQL